MPIGVLCINLDVSHYHAAIEVLSGLVALFKEDWHERINERPAMTKDRGVLVTSLSRTEKKDLAVALSADGAFG